MYSIVIVLYSGVSVCVEAEGVGMTDAGMAVMAHLVREAAARRLHSCQASQPHHNQTLASHGDGE